MREWRPILHEWPLGVRDERRKATRVNATQARNRANQPLVFDLTGNPNGDQTHRWFSKNTRSGHGYNRPANYMKGDKLQLMPILRVTNDELALLKASLGNSITASFHTQAIARKYGLSVQEFEERIKSYLALAVEIDRARYDNEPYDDGGTVGNSELNADGTSRNYIAP